MQTTIVFALFCEAFIGGVSSAHGEILCKKSANNFICPTFCRQNWLYSYECRNILVKKFQISHIYVLSCYIGYTYYGKKKPPHHCEGFLRYGNKMLGNRCGATASRNRPEAKSGVPDTNQAIGCLWWGERMAPYTPMALKRKRQRHSLYEGC